MKPEPGSRKLSIRALGGRSPAPWLSIWGPVVLKVALALVAAALLAMIGTRAAAHAWTEPAGVVSEDASVAVGARAAPGDPGVSPGAEVPRGAPPADAGAGARGRGVLPDGRIVLNAAGEEELVRLPGIGPSRARAILALRERLGRFRSVDQLRRVKGVGRKTLQRIGPKLVVDAPRESEVENDAG